MKRLTEMVSAMGLIIEYKSIKGRDGEYRHDLGVIRLRPGMTYRLERSVLAHELAHAVFGDVPSRFGPVSAKQERRAWEWAALQLISRADYARAEIHHNGHVGAMSVDLGVVTPVTTAYRGLLLRAGENVYVDPKMGAGQWAERSSVEHI